MSGVSICFGSEFLVVRLPVERLERGVAVAVVVVVVVAVVAVAVVVEGLVMVEEFEAVAVAVAVAVIERFIMETSESAL
jgi:hypothetical protein